MGKPIERRRFNRSEHRTVRLATKRHKSHEGEEILHPQIGGWEMRGKDPTAGAPVGTREGAHCGPRKRLKVMTE